jgi:hypothetical protein
MAITFTPGAVSFIAPHGQYVSASASHNILEARKSTVGEREIFLLSTAGDKFALQASNRKYVKTADTRLWAESSQIGDAEKFALLSQPGDRFSLQASTGKYICAWDGGGNHLVADRTGVDTTLQSWECFRLVRWVRLQATNNKYLQFDQNDLGRVLTNGDSLNPSSVFQLIHLDGGKIALKASNGKFLCADYGGGSRLVVNRDIADIWESFEPIKQSNGRTAFRTSNGFFLNGKDEGVTADGTANGANTTFNLVMLGSEVWPLQPDSMNLENLYSLDDTEVKKNVLQVFLSQMKASASVHGLFFASTPNGLLNWDYKDFTDNVACALASSAISRSAFHGFNRTIDQSKADTSWQTQLASENAVKASQVLYESAFADNCKNLHHTFREYLDSDAKEWAAKFAAHLTSRSYLNVEMLKLFAGKTDWLQKLNLSLYKLSRLDKSIVPSVVNAWKQAYPDKGIVENWNTYNFLPSINFQGDQFIAEVNQAINVKITESDTWIQGQGRNPIPRHSVVYSYGKAVQEFLRGKPHQLGLTTNQQPNNMEYFYG